MMIDTKFTKGDLVADGALVGFKEWGFVASVSGSITTKEEDEANAHLFAAANKMYKLLVECKSEMYQLIDEVNDQRASRITSQTENEPDYHDQQTLQEIEELLAKARGE